MEPEDQYVIQDIIQKVMTYNNYTLDPSYDALIKTVVHQNRDGSMTKQVDLSQVSTRDLLNECYRRRAIEKFTYDVSVDRYFLKQEPEAREYTTKELKRGMWEVMLKNDKFVADAIQITERQDVHHRTEFKGEVYICKHPTKVRK